MSKTTTLYRAISDLGVSNKDPQFIAIGEAIIRHVLGVEDAYACQRRLKPLLDSAGVDVSAQRFRLVVADIAYIHLNLKFFTLTVLGKSLSPKNLVAAAGAFGISRNDVVLVRMILEQRGFRREMKAHDAVKQVRKDQLTKSAFDTVFRTFNECYPELHRHIKSKVYSKMRFISVSSNVEFYDFHMELTCKAIQAYIKLVPTDMTPRHITNYLKATLNNHIVNLIKSYTTQKRKRMQKGTADGLGGFNYEIPVLSENQMFQAFGLDAAMSYENMQCPEIGREEERLRDAQLSFDLILRRFGTTRKRRMFIELVSGKENNRFTEYLKRYRLISDDQDNVDYCDRSGQDAYFKAVCAFLNVCEKRAKNFMAYIGQQAYPERC